MKYTLLLFTVLTVSANEPQYASKKTKEVIKKMIDAHGGLDTWIVSKTFSYENVMFSKSLPGSPFWINRATVDTKTKRVYQEWPLHKSSMASNGVDTWSVDWKIGNAPKFEALFFYYFLNLPWLTQDKNVTLGDVVKIKHKAFKNEVYAIDMGFKNKPAIGKTKNDTYKLYIDSKTFLLMGYEYTISYGHMLDLFGFPKDAKFFGPMFRVHDAFTNVDGLIYPNLMHTSNLEQTQIYGNHAIYDYSLNTKFDEQKMKKPKNAVIDTSSHLRKK